MSDDQRNQRTVLRILGYIAIGTGLAMIHPGLPFIAVGTIMALANQP